MATIKGIAYGFVVTIFFWAVLLAVASPAHAERYGVTVTDSRGDSHYYSIEVDDYDFDPVPPDPMTTPQTQTGQSIGEWHEEFKSKSFEEYYRNKHGDAAWEAYKSIEGTGSD